MKPVSDLTTPRTLIAPISRHFLPVAQPEPCCCTTGLKNGSRLPVIAHFFSSGLARFGASATFTGTAATAGLALAAITVLAGCCLTSAFTGRATGFAAGAFAGVLASAFAIATEAGAFACAAFTGAVAGALVTDALASSILGDGCTLPATTADLAGAGVFFATAIAV